MSSRSARTVSPSRRPRTSPSRPEPRFDARARPEALAHASEDRARVALLADVRRRARAELAHALQEVLLPREQDDRHVTQRHVALERPREREAVEPRHEDVADDELGRRAVREIEGRLAVERLVHDAPRGAKEVRDEPGDPRIVVRDDDAPPVEAHVRSRPATAPHRRHQPIRAGHVRLKPRRERDGPLRSVAAEAHGSPGSRDDDLAHARDRPPDRAHHLGPLAQRNAHAAPGGIDALDDRLP